MQLSDLPGVVHPAKPNNNIKHTTKTIPLRFDAWATNRSQRERDTESYVELQDDQLVIKVRKYGKRLIFLTK